MTFLLIAIICGLVYFWFAQNNNIKDLKAKSETLVKKLKDLEKYQVIIDLENHVANVKKSLDIEISESKNKAAAVILEAELHCKNEKETSKARLAEINSKADQILLDANNNAKKIISSANAEAKTIAGNAYEAMKKADSFEKTAIAMENIIKGYGDKYIIPTYSLLDKLAEDYSHTDAGNDLKRAREKTRSMIKSNSAALCDYVENHRKQTARDFVLDAFNGKVDSILSAVKNDNFGTLEQKVKDAFQTVNHNGTAFRNARISDLYLAARMEELKLACTVQALKEKEKEEQRRIREQIREEEKAAKDFERAMKEAQKEEEALMKSVEKVKKDLESANEMQRAQYETRLRELEQKIKETEEKNQRALSMAQQTKTGHVYIISNIGSFGEDVLKIGLTRRLDPMDRVYELGDASVPFEFDVHAMILSEDAPALEKELHRRFLNNQVNKINPRKEFFKINLKELRETIEQLGISAQWTMAAEAKEYKESLSIAEKRKAA